MKFIQVVIFNKIILQPNGEKKMESVFTALFFAHTLEDEGSNQFVSEIINSMMINTILLINQISSFYHHSLSKGHIYSILKLSLWEFLKLWLNLTSKYFVTHIFFNSRRHVNPPNKQLD